MKEITIYHNPRCGKSRAGLAIAEELDMDVTVRNYMKETVSKEELEGILTKLNYNASELIRTNETIWKSEYKGREISDSELIQAMIDHPKLIERPILIIGKRAIVGRPTEKIAPWIKSTAKLTS